MCPPRYSFFLIYHYLIDIWPKIYVGFKNTTFKEMNNWLDKNEKKVI